MNGNILTIFSRESTKKKTWKRKYTKRHWHCSSFCHRYFAYSCRFHAINVEISLRWWLYNDPDGILHIFIFTYYLTHKLTHTHTKQIQIFYNVNDVMARKTTTMSSSIVYVYTTIAKRNWNEKKLNIWCSSLRKKKVHRL